MTKIHSLYFVILLGVILYYKGYFFEYFCVISTITIFYWIARASGPNPRELISTENSQPNTDFQTVKLPDNSSFTITKEMYSKLLSTSKKELQELGIIEA